MADNLAAADIPLPGCLDKGNAGNPGIAGSARLLPVSDNSAEQYCLPAGIGERRSPEPRLAVVVAVHTGWVMKAARAAAAMVLGAVVFAVYPGAVAVVIVVIVVAVVAVAAAVPGKFQMILEHLDFLLP